MHKMVRFDKVGLGFTVIYYSVFLVCLKYFKMKKKLHINGTEVICSRS